MIHVISTGGATEAQEWYLHLDEDVEADADVEPCVHAKGVHPVDGALGEGGWRKWRLRGFVRAKNEGGYNCTEVCLDCILEAARVLAPLAPTRIRADFNVVAGLGEDPYLYAGLPTKEEALHEFPDAVWFAGDVAPVGTRVLLRPDATGARRLGEIAGRFDPPPTVPAEHCPTCACARDNTGFSGWFLVRDLGRNAVGEVGGRLTFVPVGTVGAHPLVTIEYPPSLAPVAELESESPR